VSSTLTTGIRPAKGPARETEEGNLTSLPLTGFLNAGLRDELKQTPRPLDISEYEVGRAR
jgi:hypothetical protein